MLPSRLAFHSTWRGLRLLLLLLNVKLYQRIDDELVDNKTERGTAKRAAEGGRHLAEGCVFCRVVRDGKGGACGVAGDEREVGCLMATVGAGDDRACTGVDEPLEEGVTRAHDVVARVFVKERGEQGVAEDALGDATYGGSAEPLAKGTGIGSVVGAAVGQMRPSGSSEPTGCGEERHRACEAANDLVAHGHRLRDFTRIDNHLQMGCSLGTWPGRRRLSAVGIYVAGVCGVGV